MFKVAGAVELPGKPMLRPDRFHQTANAQNADYPFHIVGQDVERHFGADVFECSHLEVRRAHPRLYRAEWMLVRRVSIEPSLHALKDGFVLPTCDPSFLACCALAL